MNGFIVRTIVSSLGGIVCGAFGLIIGTWFGGNFATWAVLFELHGYEATGMIGLVLFSVGGFILVWRRLGKDNKTRREKEKTI